MNKPIAFIVGAGDYIGSAVAKKFARVRLSGVHGSPQRRKIGTDDK